MKKIFALLFCIALFSSMQAQNFTVKGKVTSPDDPDGIAGVNVAIKNSDKGVITDVNGNYFISVPSKESVLIFSFLGFLPKEIKVGNQTNINVSMSTNATSLDEVVVVGYGEQKKASIVGAISTANNNDLKRAAPSNLTDNIAGHVTGALVRLGDGNVGGGDNRYSAGTLDDAAIFIRGKATTNSATPLILVDGVESSFSRINPEDVDQLSILKDASATAIYGVRGANGVILITTKSGSLGKPVVSVSAQVRRQSPLKFPKPLGAYDFARLYNEAEMNMGLSPKYSNADLEHWKLNDDPYGHPYADFYDNIVKPYFLEEQYIANIAGGTEAVKYYISGEYNYAGGPWKTTPEQENKYKRYNLRTNFDFKVTSSTNLSVKLNGRLESRGDLNYGESTGQRYYGSFWYGILASSIIAAPIYNPNGTYAHGSAQKWNLRMLLDKAGYRTRLSNTMDANLNLTQKLDFILKGLSARVMYGSTFTSGSRKVVNPEDPGDLWDYNATTQTYSKFFTAGPYTYNIDNSNLPNSGNTQMEAALNYEKHIAEVHNITAMVVAMQSRSESGYTLPVSHRGISGRITYDYMQKYLAEVNMGYNGSDQFSKGHRYAMFPSASIGWAITNESFMKDVKFISFLKPRLSYGLAGNDQIGGYRYLYQYEFDPTNGGWTAYQNETYNFGVSPVSQSGMQEGTLGNNNVSWEIAKKANAGLDAQLWKNKIKLTADVFQEKRDNILAIRGDVPYQTGLVTSKLPAQNIGRVTNKGYEFELSYDDRFGNVDVGVGGTYTFAHNNIDYIAEVQMKYPYQMQAGHPIGQTFGYVWTGKFYDYPDLTNPNVPKPAGTLYAGDLMFKDLNGDGVIDNNDVTAIGYPQIPEIIYGFYTNLGYKGFYLNVFWQGAGHVSSEYYNELRYEFSSNVLPFHLDRWAYYPDLGIDTRATAKYPSLIPGGSAQTKTTSSFQVLDASYLRLKTVEFGYYFPKKLIRKMQMSDLKLFISGSNVLTFDKIGWIDPEYNPYDSGNRGNSYPQTKFFAFGVNVTF